MAHAGRDALKGWFRFIEVRWYEVPNHGQCVAFDRWWSAHPQFEEAVGSIFKI